MLRNIVNINSRQTLGWYKFCHSNACILNTVKTVTSIQHLHAHLKLWIYKWNTFSFTTLAYTYKIMNIYEKYVLVYSQIILLVLLSTA